MRAYQRDKGLAVNGRADADTWARLQRDPRVLAMPAYPADGCVQVLDGVAVVRLGEITDLDKGDPS